MCRPAKLCLQGIARYTCTVCIITSKLKMLLNILNDRKSKETSEVTGESDLIIVPNSMHFYGVVMPTACVSPPISYVTDIICRFMIVISNMADSFSDTP